jgi:DNA mismatch repair ATPase MutS
MKVLLLNKNNDVDLQQKLPWNEKALTQDLELNILFKAMAGEDDFLFEVVRKVILTGLNNNIDTILYRQHILKDCLKNPSIITRMYELAVEAIESRKKSWFSIFTTYPSSILSGSIGMMEIFVDILKTLRNTADEHAGKFDSEGFSRFFGMIKKELGDEYFTEVENHLRKLKFSEGILMSAELGKGNKGINYVLHKLQDKKQSWIERLFPKKPQGYTFYIHPRDESGVRALSELRNEGINLVANVLAQSADHILGFFNLLRTELAFYIGCLNLHERLTEIEEQIFFPFPAPPEQRKHSFRGLYDPCLALSMNKKMVGNEMNADSKNLFIITGANQGGKSTFLRSIALSQLMMQCGMFVPAQYFCANICDSLLTHFKREEDSTMKSGKLDEELSRMSEIADHITSNSMLLFNESFAATNEREGSEIARQIVTALLEKHVKVFFVTHLYEFAHNFYDKKLDNAIFLQAQRQTDTTRSFKLIEGEPLQTSYGVDVYNKIFETNRLLLQDFAEIENT